jgi:hypothetical protein
MSSCLSSLPALLAAAVMLAVAAAPAMAEQRIDYAMTVDGTIDYNRADDDGGATAQHDERIDFHTHVPKLSFFGEYLESTAPALGTATLVHGSYTVQGDTGGYGCGDHSLRDVTGGGYESITQAGRSVISIRTVDSFTVGVGGCPGGLGNWDYPFTSGGMPVGTGIFDGVVMLSHDRIGDGSMSFPLSGAVSGGECPNAHFNTALCSLTWDATVTFTRTGEEEMDGEFEPVPIPPGPTPPPAAAEEDDLLVPSVPQAKLAKSLGVASLPFTCASACTGTLTATARGTRLARKAFDADSGESRVKLRFDRADRRAIRRAGKVKLTLAATVGGEATKESVVLRVPR